MKRFSSATLVDGEAAIVVRGIEQAGVGQREELQMDGAVHVARRALLEIGAPAAADQERVAGEGHALVVEHVAQAAMRVAGRGAHFEMPRAERHLVAVLEVEVGAFARRSPRIARCGFPSGA